MNFTYILLACDNLHYRTRVTIAVNLVVIISLFDFNDFEESHNGFQSLSQRSYGQSDAEG